MGYICNLAELEMFEYLAFLKMTSCLLCSCECQDKGWPNMHLWLLPRVLSAVPTPIGANTWRLNRNPSIFCCLNLALIFYVGFSERHSNQCLHYGVWVARRETLYGWTEFSYQHVWIVAGTGGVFVQYWKSAHNPRSCEVFDQFGCGLFSRGVSIMPLMLFREIIFCCLPFL